MLGLRTKLTAEELRGGQEPVAWPTLPVRRPRPKSQIVADAQEHEQWLEDTVEALKTENARLTGEHTREMAEIRAQMSMFEESNKILHEQIANEQASHAAAIANMQAKLDEANEAVAAVGTLVTTSAEVLTKCLRYLPKRLRTVEPPSPDIDAESIGRKYGANSQAQEGDGG